MRKLLQTPRSPAKPGFSNRRLGAAVHFYALRNRRTGVIGHFVANDVHQYFLVNETTVPPSTVIGPLSDFSVIQVGSDVVFWWQNRQSLDYKPVSTMQSSFGRHVHITDTKQRLRKGIRFQVTLPVAVIKTPVLSRLRDKMTLPVAMTEDLFLSRVRGRVAMTVAVTEKPDLRL